LSVKEIVTSFQNRIPINGLTHVRKATRRTEVFGPYFQIQKRKSIWHITFWAKQFVSPIRLPCLISAARSFFFKDNLDAMQLGQSIFINGLSIFDGNAGKKFYACLAEDGCHQKI